MSAPPRLGSGSHATMTARAARIAELVPPLDLTRRFPRRIKPLKPTRCLANTSAVPETEVLTGGKPNSSSPTSGGSTPCGAEIAAITDAVMLASVEAKPPQPPLHQPVDAATAPPPLRASPPDACNLNVPLHHATLTRAPSARMHTPVPVYLPLAPVHSLMARSARLSYSPRSRDSWEGSSAVLSSQQSSDEEAVPERQPRVGSSEAPPSLPPSPPMPPPFSTLRLDPRLLGVSVGAAIGVALVASVVGAFSAASSATRIHAGCNALLGTLILALNAAMQRRGAHRFARAWATCLLIIPPLQALGACLLSTERVRAGLASMRDEPAIVWSARLVAAIAGVVHASLPRSLGWRLAVATCATAIGTSCGAFASQYHFGSPDELFVASIFTRALPFFLGFGGALVLASPSHETAQPWAADDLPSERGCARLQIERAPLVARLRR